ncbi:MAG TPA: hypothetical protein PKK06_05380 [Phycisphaerae bacterium]|nr:hypothetical protein [Phycisphaerae bacterium]HNU44811.1 hypothetical protein [Phycisphaerae bacterium]
MDRADDETIGCSLMDRVHDDALAVGRDEGLMVSLKTRARRLDAWRSSIAATFACGQRTGIPGVQPYAILVGERAMREARPRTGRLRIVA